MTEWPELSSPDFAALRTAMTGDVLVDGRNVWSGACARDAGFWYASIGRSTAAPAAAVAHSAA
jgi:UDPglucose 6-dehydrogenase